MRLLSVLAVLLLILPLFFVSVPAETDDDWEEMVGDWIITENTTVLNRNISLQGNLKILSGGLTLINSNIHMKCYAEGQFKVSIGKDAYLRMYNSSFDRQKGYEAYYIVADENSDFLMRNSSIRHAGYADRDRSGLYLFQRYLIQYSIFCF